jgi:hypothetical protein
MAEEIIRSTKEHEVSIPEGSNNAKSRQSTVGIGELNIVRKDSVKAAQEHQNRQAAGEAIRLDAERVVVPGDEDREPNIVSIQDSAPSGSSVVRLPSQEGKDDNTIQLPQDRAADDNIIAIPTDHSEDSRAMLPTEDKAHHHQVEVPTDQITDPSRVIVEDGAVVRKPPTLVFPEESKVSEEDPADELQPHLVVHSSEDAPQIAAISSHDAEDLHSEPVLKAQVVGSLADKWQQEFRGRVVKLREEVDVLNERLDKLEK